ncbi:MAG: GNAT family N-acetyltransferase [Hyphomicrobiales bacterium]|nr:GNAT family N-acetyltransferase [Hyphomicrobiales bacterium]
MPQPVLTTKRLILRPFRSGDAPVIARLANHPSIAEITATIRYPYPALDTVRFVRCMLTRPEDATRGPFLLTLKSNPCYAVGAAGLHTGKHGYLIGYWVGAAFRRRVYASEAARALAQYGFETLELPVIEISCRTHNHASRRIIERLGGRGPKLRMGWSRMLGQKMPTLYYDVTRGNFLSSNRLRLSR